MSDEAALGAPRAIKLKGTTYLANPLTPRDFAELARYLKSQCETQSALAAIAADLKDLPPEVKAEAIRAAVALQAGTAKGKKIEPSREAINEMAGEVPGLRYALWVACRKNHPDLTLEATETLVDEANRDDVFTELLTANDQPVTADPNSNGRHG